METKFISRGNIITNKWHWEERFCWYYSGGKGSVYCYKCLAWVYRI